MAAASAPGPPKRGARRPAAFGARSASAKGKVVVVSELGQEFLNFGKREFINFRKRDCQEEAGEGWKCAFVVSRSAALAQLCSSKH